MQCPLCSGEDITLVEYGYPSPNAYDGISEVRCNDCNKRFGKWSGKELTGDEEETRFGK